MTVSRLRYAVPQWHKELKAGLRRAHERLSRERVDGVDWFWPADEDPGLAVSEESVRMLSPFDPVVWDRRRFELLWGWAYRFEAYTPAPKRKLGYYALPLLWRDRVIGWANVSVQQGELRTELGFVEPGRPIRSRLQARTRAGARSDADVSRDQVGRDPVDGEPVDRTPGPRPPDYR